MQPTDKTKVKRAPSRGNYDIRTINQILDAHFLCHLGFIYEGYPVVIPTLYGRSGKKIYIHGASTSRMIKSLEKGIDVSVAITLVDGIVMARSAFHHSMNYRSVVLFGKAEKVIGEDDKLDALKCISDQVAPERWKEVRFPNQKELKATVILSLLIEEASAKVRTGPPADEKDDYDREVWAGEIPLKMKSSEIVNDPLLKDGIEPSKVIQNIVNKYS